MRTLMDVAFALVLVFVLLIVASGATGRLPSGSEILACLLLAAIVIAVRSRRRRTAVG